MQAARTPSSESLLHRVFSLPRTQLGWSGLMLLGVHLVLLALVLLLPVNRTLHLSYRITLLPAFAAALASGVVTLIVAIRQGERSIFDLAAIVWAVLVTAFALGEVLSPH